MNICRQSKLTLTGVTLLWALIMLTVCALMYFQVQISTHFSYYILIEFTKAISLWYVISIICAFCIDITHRKKQGSI